MELASEVASAGGLLLTAFFSGVRHGFDIDHLAAIADITGVPERPVRNLLTATAYALGHAAVLAALGLGAVLLGARIPATLDAVMGKVVGLTLVLLGGYLAVSVIKDGDDVRLLGRWSLVGRLARDAAARMRSGAQVIVVEHSHPHEPGHHPDPQHPGPPHPGLEPAARLDGGDGDPAGVPVRTAHLHPHVHVGTLPPDPFPSARRKAALVTGAIHGVGAETPTQILLFAAAAGAATSGIGLLVLATFVGGLFLANTVVAGLCTIGFRTGSAVPHLRAGMAAVAAALSLCVGLLYLLG